MNPIPKNLSLNHLPGLSRHPHPRPDSFCLWHLSFFSYPKIPYQHQTRQTLPDHHRQYCHPNLFSPTLEFQWS